MFKNIFSIFILSVMFFSSVLPVRANLLVVKNDGEVVVKVLAAQDGLTLQTPQDSDLGIEKVADSSVHNTTNISLRNSDGGVKISVTDSDGTKQLSVNKSREDLVEIEERPQVRKLNIGVENGEFTILQKGVLAKTKFPLKINSEEAKISLSTDSGEQYLSVYPYDAAQTALRTKLLTRISGNGVEITDEENKLQYKISGERVINLFNVYNYTIPVSSYISASTGEMLRVDAPGWLRVINFLFS